MVLAGSEQDSNLQQSGDICFQHVVTAWFFRFLKKKEQKGCFNETCCDCIQGLSVNNVTYFWTFFTSPLHHSKRFLLLRPVVLNHGVASFYWCVAKLFKTLNFELFPHVIWHFFRQNNSLDILIVSTIFHSQNVCRQLKKGWEPQWLT